MNAPIYRKEKEIARSAIVAAMEITRRIQNGFSRGDTLTKADRSPVTIADFAVQAIVCKILNERLGPVAIVGEEDSEALKKSENREVLEKVLSFTSTDRKRLTPSQLFALIDLAHSSPGESFWTVDPIDGTKGFLRGDQYALALALISGGQVRIGILGCPRLCRSNRSRSSAGFIFSAVKGEGAEALNLSTGASRKIHVSRRREPGLLRMVGSYESSHHDPRTQEKIASFLHLRQAPQKLDGQVKYGIVASGDADLYLRIPNPRTPDYRENIWDHAAGCLLLEEAGGMVTDISGKKIDFSRGTTLSGNSGIVASNGLVHSRILEAVSRSL
jgi:3'(2'), 5'-bisphosphate nucleotidase